MAEKQSGGALDKLSEAKKKLDLAEAAYKKKLQAAEGELESARKKHDDLVKQKSEKVAEAKAILNGKIAEVDEVCLYGDRIVLEYTVFLLGDDVEFEIATSGAIATSTEIEDKGPNVVGALVGGAVAGSTGAIIGGQKRVGSVTREHDNRKLFLTVVSDFGSGVCAVDPDKELELRKLVAEARQAIRTLEDRREESRDAAAAAQQELAEAESDTKELDEANERYDRIKNDATELDEAKGAYEKLVASIDPAELKREKREKICAFLRKAYLVPAYGFGAMLVLDGLDCLVGGAPLEGMVELLITDFLLVSATMILRDDILSKKDTGSDLVEPEA